MPLATEHLRHLVEISRLLAEIGTDLDAVVQRLSEAVSVRLEAGALLELIGPDGRTLATAAVHHADPAAAALARRLADGARSTVGDGLTGTVAATGAHVLLPQVDQAALRARLTEDVRLYLDRFAVETVVAVPLRTHEGTIGVITLWRDRPDRPFDERDVALLQAIADHASLAIINARLYARLRGTHTALETRTRDLEQALGELESFAWSVSHDLRAPLHTIQGFARAFDEDFGDGLDAVAREFLDRIQSGAERMNELIEALLDLSRISRQELAHETVDLTALLLDLGAHQRRETGRAVTLEVQPDLTVRGDARLLRTAFGHLLSNAWKFTGSRSGPKVTVTGADQPEGLELTVADNGAGFDMSHAGRLFSPFQRLHSRRDFPGAGIGLATVQRIVRRHGGDVTGHGEPGKGATFRVLLPRGT